MGAGYEERANLLISAIRDSSYGPTSVIVRGRPMGTPGRGADQAAAARDANVDKRAERTQAPARRAEAIGDVVPLSTRGATQVEVLIKRGRAVEELATKGKPELDIVRSVVESRDAKATVDHVTGNVLVEVTSYVTEEYRTGVVSEGEDVTNVVFDARTGDILTLEPVTLEDIAQAIIEPVDGSLDESESSMYGTISDPEGVELRAGSGRAAPSARVLPSAVTSTGRQNIVNYAVKYWSTYNTAYKSFSPTDCTNFVSQAMERGGWSHVTGLWNEDTHWW